MHQVLSVPGSEGRGIAVPKAGGVGNMTLKKCKCKFPSEYTKEVIQIIRYLEEILKEGF